MFYFFTQGSTFILLLALRWCGLKVVSAPIRRTTARPFQMCDTLALCMFRINVRCLDSGSGELIYDGQLWKYFILEESGFEKDGRISDLL